MKSANALEQTSTQKRKKRSGSSIRDDIELTLLAVPTTVWYLIFCYLPMFGLVLAFKDYRIVDATKGFIYNLIQSDRVNDREQLVDAILCFYGMKFTPEQMAELKEHRMISNIPMDGKIEYLIKTLNESDTDILRKNIENDIHKISMTPNLADENFANNSSGVAISYKLLAFDQNIKNKERYFERGLMERFRLYNNFLNTKRNRI